MHTNKLRTMASAWLLAFVALAVCAGAPEADSKNTLVVGLLSEPNTLNPLVSTSAETQDILRRVFIKLADEQADFLTFKPRLAKSWKFSRDRLTLTFELRDDVFWHDGQPVTAEDVRFTWELHTDTTVAWPSASDKQFIRDVEVIDPYKVAFHFTQRYLYQLMDANDGPILPKHILGDVPRPQLRAHAYGRAPVGNGPYRVSRWEAGQYIELTANPDYYEGAPVVERVMFRFVPDMVTLITALKKGEVDMLESVPADQLADVEANQLIDLYRFPSRRINFVAWNLANPLFENPVVREALARSVNRKEIIDALWAGFARECKGPVSPLLWAYDRSIRPIRFDPTEATRMFRTRGWRDSDGDGVLDKDGKPLAFDIIVNNNQLRIDVVTMVAAHLRRVGVKATIRVLEFSTYGDRLMKGNYEAAFVGIKNSTKMDITAYWHSSAAPPNGFNVFSYSNEDVDKWIDEAKVQLDVSRAERLWSKVQSKIYEDQPVMFLAVPDEVVALHARFCNVQPNALSFLVNLRGWRVEPNCER